MYQIIIDGVLCKEKCKELKEILPWIDIALIRGAEVVELMYNLQTIEVFWLKYPILSQTAISNQWTPDDLIMRGSDIRNMFNSALDIYNGSKHVAIGIVCQSYGIEQSDFELMNSI